MRRRLYFLLPDIDTANQLEKDLLLAHIDDHHMHFLSSRNTDLGQLHKANILQRTDLIHGMFVGLIAGAATGLALGSLLYLYSVFGPEVGTAPILILAIIGALFGSWASGMIAISTPNSHLKSFKRSLDKGQILVMIDTPKDRVEEITELVKSLHPSVSDRGIESHIPAFP